MDKGQIISADFASERDVTVIAENKNGEVTNVYFDINFNAIYVLMEQDKRIVKEAFLYGTPQRTHKNA